MKLGTEQLFLIDEDLLLATLSTAEASYRDAVVGGRPLQGAVGAHHFDPRSTVSTERIGRHLHHDATLHANQRGAELLSFTSVRKDIRTHRAHLDGIAEQPPNGIKPLYVTQERALPAAGSVGATGVLVPPERPTGTAEPARGPTALMHEVTEGGYKDPSLPLKVAVKSQLTLSLMDKETTIKTADAALARCLE